MADDFLIRLRLEHDDAFAIKCLLKLYELQEADEKDVHSSYHKNGVGFNKTDAGQLTVLAEQVKFHSSLGPTAMTKLHEVLPKYAKQLSRYLTDEEVEI